MRDTVRGACELLGLDPLHIANEGQFLAVVAAGVRGGCARGVARSARRRSGRASSAKCANSRPARCSASTLYGGTRVVDMLVGDPLPRIC